MRYYWKEAGTIISDERLKARRDISETTYILDPFLVFCYRLQSILVEIHFFLRLILCMSDIYTSFE